MENRLIPNFFEILKNERKLTKVLLFIAQEEEVDPYYHKKTLNYQQPITIDALVRDVSPEAVYYKYYGQIPIGSKEIICEKRHLNTIKAADRIKIGDKYFKTRKDDAKGFNIIERRDYIVAIVELKITNV